jgi:hypothetical protein
MRGEHLLHLDAGADCWALISPALQVQDKTRGIDAEVFDQKRAPSVIADYQIAISEEALVCSAPLVPFQGWALFQRTFDPGGNPGKGSPGDEARKLFDESQIATRAALISF